VFSLKPAAKILSLPKKLILVSKTGFIIAITGHFQLMYHRKNALQLEGEFSEKKNEKNHLNLYISRIGLPILLQGNMWTDPGNI
jgi:hypothetical protein